MTHNERYTALISGAMENPSTLPGEMHHVVPRAIHKWRPFSFGVNAPDNLVYLSHQQHLQAHWLLWEIWRENSQLGGKMAMAFNLMMSAAKTEPTAEQLEKFAVARIASTQALSAALKGRKQSAETRAKKSAALKGRVSPMKGKKTSAETRAKQSAAQKGRKKSAEHRAKLSAAAKARAASKKAGQVSA